MREALEQLHESLKTLRRELDYSYRQLQPILAQCEQDVAILRQEASKPRRKRKDEAAG